MLRKLCMQVPQILWLVSCCTQNFCGHVIRVGEMLLHNLPSKNAIAPCLQGTGGQENKTRSKKMSGSERTAVQFLHLGMPTVGIYRPA